MKIKNVAIIAHVDHGKTTMIDKILRFCAGSIDKKEDRDRIMDSNDIERERGITILSKNTAVHYKDYLINIVDTPGHADFGGEVERVLKMVDSCLLLVDAFEGPMPQTRFVLRKALQLNKKIILVINKIDRDGVNIEAVIDKTFELFLELNANDEQIDFPVVYASAKNGYAIRNLSDEKKDISPILDVILEKVPDAGGKESNPFMFQVTTLDYNEYLGRLCIGRIFDGKLSIGNEVKLLGLDEKGNLKKSSHKISKLFRFHGLKRVETDSAHCGDIVAIAGIPDMTISDTLCDPGVEAPLTRIEIEPPTVSMQFSVNDSPFAGREGKLVTSRNIRDRLMKEIQTNLSLRVEDLGDSFVVAARGELQLAILIENMRREGFELGVSKPQVVFKEVDGKKMEPFEEVVIDMPEVYSGKIIQELNRRKGMMQELENISAEFVRVRYEIPTRGLIGFRSFILTESRGEGTLSSIFLGYRDFVGSIPERTKGALISMDAGATSTYALFNLQERGELFIGAQTPVYVGMIIGLNQKDNDLEVNPVKEKKLTNVRNSGTEDALKLIPPRKLSLEQSMDILDDDEILEVTPASLRLRKKILDAAFRKRKKA
ncbi:MAG: translational GTPase TypA [Spirochaetia bacterium]|nr:translational GTPase TypA [Spirochaetia bacterium]